MRNAECGRQRSEVTEVRRQKSERRLPNLRNVEDEMRNGKAAEAKGNRAERRFIIFAAVA